MCNEERQKKNPASHWDSCSKWNTWRLHVASRLQGYSILIRVLETSFIRLSLISPTHPRLKHTHTKPLIPTFENANTHPREKKDQKFKKEKKKKRFYNNLSDTHIIRKQWIGDKTIVPFHFGEKTITSAFNCIFFGAKVIINFAQGETHMNQ